MHDLFVNVLFYIFAIMAILSALMVITQNNPVRCVLFLVLTFFSSAVLWLLASAEFLALILVLVYVGAVMTLFLFVVMMLDIDTESLKTHFVRYLPFGLILVALLVGLLLIALPENVFNKDAPPIFNSQSLLSEAQLQDSPTVVKNISNTEAIGMVLYTDYVFAFELAAVLLLVAIIAAITLAHRGTIRSKSQDITQQIMIRKEDRITLLSMKSESKH